MIYDPRITVEKVEERPDMGRETAMYRVVRAVCTVSPRVGTVLNEASLKELINPCGVHVTIKEARHSK